MALACVLTGARAAGGFEAAGLERVLARAQAPAGVVFEIVGEDETELAPALAAVTAAAARLRERFPGLALEVVIHGEAEFALAHEERAVYGAAHERAEALVEDDVPVTLCGAFAGMRGFSPGDFAGYVTVAEDGPERISALQAQGYVRLMIEPLP